MSESTGPDRLPPQSRDAERSVLGSMLRDNVVINDVLQILQTAESFYFDAHQKIFHAIKDTYNDGHPVDLVILTEVLKSRKQIEDVGGVEYLADLWEAAPTAANAEYYAKIVREKAIIRSLIHASTEILRDAYDQVQPAEELLGQAESKILDIAEKGVTSNTTTILDALNEAYTRIDQRMGRKDPNALSGIATGFVDLDALTAGFQNNELIIVAARPSVGKCLTADAEIVLQDGSVASIEELCHRRHAPLFTLADDWKFRPAAASAFVDDGIKPVFRVTTRLGRVIETTASHPFRTFDGWQPLADLRAGDRIAVPRRLPVFGTAAMRPCEVRLLAYLIGDGCLTDTTPEFTNGDPRVRADFTAAVQEFGGLKVRAEAHGGRTPTLHVAADPDRTARARSHFAERFGSALRQTGRTAGSVAKGLGVSPALVCLWGQGECAPDGSTLARLADLLGVPVESLAPDGPAAARKSARNGLTRWLDELGLMGKGARDKFVPRPVFALPREQLALFLNRLFATDGWATVLGGGQTQIGYGSVSERLVRQVQHLLLRFGIIGKVRPKKVTYKGETRSCYQIDITDGESVETFAREIGIFGKEAAVNRVSEARLNRRRQTNCDLVPRAAWTRLAAAKGGASWASVAGRAGLCDRTNLHVGARELSRGRLRRIAQAVGDLELVRLADSDVYWDRIESIEAVGSKQVYDLTIPVTHNFIANDICVHNTAFSLNLVRHVVVEERLPVLFVSLEQSRIEIAERLLAAQARVDSHKLRKGHLSGEDIGKLHEAGDVLRNANLFIDDSPAQGMLRIAANARRLKIRKPGLRLVVIDYLQLIEPENRRDPRQEQVAQISRRLKHLARELEIPVIALAQVNRSSEDRQDHRPRLADLRESGSIEQDADTCLMLHRPGRFDGGQEDNIIEVIVAKQRNGPTGEITLAWLKNYMRFENYAGDGAFGIG